jgi:hypothetical protein
VLATTHFLLAVKPLDEPLTLPLTLLSHCLIGCMSSYDCQFHSDLGELKYEEVMRAGSLTEVLMQRLYDTEP